MADSERGGPPSYESDEQDGPLPDGLYVLTNNKSRTVLDLWGGTLTGKLLVGCTGFSQFSSLRQETPGEGQTVQASRATPMNASTINYGSLSMTHQTIRTL